jgi:hypothetical protein
LIDSQDFFPLEWVLLTLLTKLRECWYKECLFYASVMFFFFCRTILYWRSLKWNNKPTDGIIYSSQCVQLLCIFSLENSIFNLELLPEFRFQPPTFS